MCLVMGKTLNVLRVPVEEEGITSFLCSWWLRFLLGVGKSPTYFLPIGIEGFFGWCFDGAALCFVTF